MASPSYKVVVHDGQPYKTIHDKLSVNPYGVSHLQFKKAMLRALISEGWVISSQREDGVVGQYKKCKLQLSRKGGLVSMDEIFVYSCFFQPDWLKQIQASLSREVHYYVQANIAEKIESK